MTQMLRALIEHRRFIFNSALADLRYRYAGTSMGILWHVVQPLSLIALFSLLFAGLMSGKAGTNSSAATVLFITSGMLPWLAFSDCIARCTTSLTDNAHYLRKLALPEIVFVARSAVTAAMLMMLSLALVLVVAMFCGVAPKWSWLALPFAGLFMVMFGFGIGLVLAPLQVFFRDVGHGIGVLLQFWMWLTPVVLREEVLPRVLREAQVVNPAYWYLRAIRQSVFGEAADPLTWFMVIAIAVLSMNLGRVLLWRVRSDVRDAL